MAQVHYGMTGELKGEKEKTNGARERPMNILVLLHRR